MPRVQLSPVLLVATMVAGCPSDPPQFGSDTDSIATTSGPDSGAGDGTGSGGGGTTNEVDILFVIDNSGSMAEEQAAIATSAAALTASLDAAGVDYRIAVTTTDVDNPWCSGTTPEVGRPRLSSCRSRQDEFVFVGAQQIDATAEACLEICAAETLEVLPTDVVGDIMAAPRPWIEVTAGVSNIDGLAIADALACALPQGINGCGFEQPLEAMYKAIALSDFEDDQAFGFFRTGAVPVVIIVSDEADCSYNPDQETIFLPDDDRFFWSLPDEPTPTSAVCWNAGVQCNGGGCTPANLDALGADTSEANAVMRPVSRYVDTLQELEDAAAAVTPGVDLLVEVFGGFTPDGSVVYQPSADPAFQDDYGIGPGCSSSAGEAVPMVRIVAVADAMATDGHAPLSSICDASFDSKMAGIAQRIIGELGG
ncbi:MAG: hypothetical protein AAF721_12110 [Myxococcota bacterium]